MQLEVITPDKKVFEGEASSIILPGADGGFEVLDRHAALISSIVDGKIRIKTSEGDQHFEVSGGVVEVLNNKVILLTESAK